MQNSGLPGLIAVLLLVGASGSLAASETGYRFPTDRVYRYKYVKEERFSYKAKKGKVNNIRFAEHTLEFHGREENYGEQRVEIVYRDLKVRLALEGLSFVFDSRKKYSVSAVRKNPLVGVFCGLQGERYETSFQSGRVAGVSGFSELFGRGASRGLTGTTLLSDVFKDTAAAVLSDQDNLTGFRMVFIELPDSLQKGTEWPGSFAWTTSGIEVRLSPVYRVTSNKKGKLGLSIGGKLNLFVDGQAIPKDGTFKGSASVDLENRRLQYTKCTSKIKLPNISMQTRVELVFQKELSPEEVGALSFEKPLRALQKVLERRTVSMPGDLPAPLYSTADCEKCVFAACKGDVLRVVERAEGAKGKVFRVITMLGREGWIPMRCTAAWEVK